jgi:hypothetical protein
MVELGDSKNPGEVPATSARLLSYRSIDLLFYFFITCIGKEKCYYICTLLLYIEKKGSFPRSIDQYCCALPNQHCSLRLNNFVNASRPM